MDRSTGLSERDREALLTRIESLLGDTPKGKLVNEIVQGLPSAAREDTVESDVPEAD